MSATTEPAEADETSFAGRFRALERLRQDRGVETFLADDLRRGGRVVVKAISISRLAAGARLRLEHEAEALREGLGAAIEVGSEGEVLFVVRPFVPGVTLAARLSRGPLALAEGLALARALCAALRDAHAHGVFHRDVKPENVILGESGLATLIDFGLARTLRPDASIRAEPARAALYVSPEQAGLLEHGVDERSDLYSAGVLLFECFAGRPPFQGARIGDILRQHLSARPPDLTGVPCALDEVIQRLLKKDPRARYQSAEGVLADLVAIAAALARGEAEPALVLGLSDRRRTLTEPAFVGRGHELEALEAELARAREGHGGLAFVEAESGGGKTWILAELAKRGAHKGFWVLRGQAVDQAAERPFEVLHGVAADVLAAARTEPGLAEAVRARLGEHREAVSTALPELAEVTAPGAAEPGPEAFAETRSLQALAALLDALGTAERPAAVLLDDCQWADELTLKLLRQWQRAARPRHAIVVAAFRSEEVPATHFLRTLAPSARVVLPPFRAADVRGLVESMAGKVPEEALALVDRLSGGSPFMASAVLRGLVETGAIVESPTGWKVEPFAMADAQSSRQAAAFLTRRLTMLPAEARRVLSCAAVLGKEFDAGLAATLARETSHGAIEAIDEARRRQILWARGEEGSYSFVHDKIREALLALLPADDRRALHAVAAHEIEARDPRRVLDIAYHFDAAGEHERALPFAIAAAEEARQQHALELAERQYRIAERGAAGAEARTRYRIAEGLGDVLMLRGRYDESSVCLESARAQAQSDEERAAIDGKLGELAFKRGDVGQAGSAIERALRGLGRRVPRGAVGFILFAVWEVLVQAMHTLFPRLFLARKDLAAAARDLLAARLYSRLAYAYWFYRGTVPCFWAHLREMDIAERYPPTAELAQAYSEHAPAMTMVPYWPRGIAYAERSLAIRRERCDVWGEGQSLHFYGVVLYAASRFEECIEKCREAVRLMERTGDRWEVNTASWHIAYCLYRLGDLGGAVEMARRVHQMGLEIGDHQASGISIGAWAKASGGRVPAALMRAELARPNDDVHTTAEVLQAQAICLLREGRAAEAANALAVAQRKIEAKGLRQEYVAPVLPWLATALEHEAGALALVLAAGEGRSSRALVDRALAASRPTVFRGDAPGEGDDESLLLAGVKSALSAPIFARGRVRACFYVAHREVAGLFGEDEVRLAEFIAAIAGAALENADGFAELRRLADTLEARVAERTAAAEARARELDRSNEELRRFASVASHDLQEPLRKIQTFGDRLRKKCEDALGAVGLDYLERMQNASRRMQTLIDGLLTLSRVTTQAEPFAAVDLGAIARDAVSDLEVRLEQTGGRVELRELPTVQGDPVQLRQMLQNLIANALKYHRKGVPPVVTVHGRAADGRCEVAVADNGIGIEEKYFGRIFEVFQRLHGASEYEGAGVGLAICRKIAERHHGAIEVESRVGEGSTFRVTFPVVQTGSD